MRSLLNRSAISSRANRPRRFTQAPRLVETVTSGEVVTMRRANSLSLLADLVHEQAEALLRRHRRLRRQLPARRARRPRRAIAPRPSGDERHLRQGTPAAAPPAATGPRTAPIRGPRARPCAARSVSICAGVISPA